MYLWLKKWNHIINTMVSIVVDDRERFVGPNFSKFTVGDRNYNIINRRLTVGDFAVVYQGSTLILIERKTWKDLNATFLDQNRKFNYLKMVDERRRQFEENGVNVRIFYLLEGKQTGTTVDPRTLMTHVNHLMFDHNIQVLYSKSPEHSAEVIINLTYDLCTSTSFDETVKQITSKIDGDGVDGGGGVKIADNLTSTKEPTQKAVYYAMWKSIAGCSDSMVVALEENKVAFQFLLLGLYDISKLSDLRRQSGAMIPVKQVKKVLESAILLETHKKVLMCVTGVSLPRATAILEKFNMQALLYTTTIDDIANISINSRRLGEALATRLLVALRTTTLTESSGT